MIDIDSTLTAVSLAGPAAHATEVPHVASLAEKLPRGSVLVALSPGSDASGAISVAEALEQRYGTTVHSVFVFEHTHSALPAAVPRGWNIHLDVGRPVEGIVRCAHRIDATLIALGLRQHGVVDRILHDETVLATARRVSAPMLAVSPELKGLPRRAVVAVDFGPASVRAARAAIDLIARPVTPRSALLRLAYVDGSPNSYAATGDRGGAFVTRLGIESAFEQLIRELNPPPYLRVDSTVLYGAPGEAVLDFAAASEADLIAIGRAARERPDPVALGDLARAVIRAGHVSVLVTPAPPNA